MLRDLIRMLAVGGLIGLCLMGCALAAASTANEPPAPPLCTVSAAEQASEVIFPINEPMPKQGVVVRVQIEFNAPAAEPAVQVIYNSGTQAFADSVLARVNAYRLSCPPGRAAQATYTREFQFVPGDPPKVISSRLREAPRVAAAGAPDQCWTGGEKSPLPPLHFSDDTSKFRAKAGIVVVMMTFAGPDVPPTVRVLVNTSGPQFELVVLEHVKGYRVPCLKADDKPFVTWQVFEFRYEDQPQLEPAKLTLQQFLGSVDKLTEQRVRFDFTTMGCPFDVPLTYFQPHAPNTVDGPLGRDVHKREFIEWLERATLKPALTANNKLLNRTLSINVPCLVLDLS